MHLHADLRHSRAQQLVGCQLLRLQEGQLLLSSVCRPCSQLKLLQDQERYCVQHRLLPVTQEQQLPPARAPLTGQACHLSCNVWSGTARTLRSSAAWSNHRLKWIRSMQGGECLVGNSSNTAPNHQTERYSPG